MWVCNVHCLWTCVFNLQFEQFIFDRTIQINRFKCIWWIMSSNINAQLDQPILFLLKPPNWNDNEIPLLFKRDAPFCIYKYKTISMGWKLDFQNATISLCVTRFKYTKFTFNATNQTATQMRKNKVKHKNQFKSCFWCCNLKWTIP